MFLAHTDIMFNNICGLLKTVLYLRIINHKLIFNDLNYH